MPVHKTKPIIGDHTTVENLKFELISEKKNVAELTSQITTLNNEINIHNMDIKTKNKRISSLEKDIKFKTLKLEELMAINIDLNKKLEGKPTHNHQTQIIEVLKAELNSEKLKISDLTSKSINLIKENRTHTKDINNKTKIISSLERQNKLKTNKLEDLTNKYKKVYTESMVTEKALEKLKSECKNPMENYMNKEKLLKNKIMQIEELNKNIKILTDERRELKVQLEDTVKAFKEVEDEVKKLNTRNKELESKKTRFIFTGTELGDKERELKECQTENQRLRDLFNDDGQTIVVLDTIGKTIKSGRIADYEDQECHIMKKKQMENKIYKLNQENDKLKLTIVELKQNMADCIRIHEHDKRKLIECKKHNIMETKKISDKDNDLINSDYKILSLKRVVEKLEELDNRKSEEIKLYKQQNNDRSLKIAKQKDEFKRLLVVKMKGQHANMKYKKTIEHLTSEINDYHKLINSKQELLNIANSKFIKQELMYSNMERSNAQLQDRVFGHEIIMNKQKIKTNEQARKLEDLMKKSVTNTTNYMQHLNNAQKKIDVLSRQKNDLTYKNKCITKIKNDNKILTAQKNEIEQSEKIAKEELRKMKGEVYSSRFFDQALKHAKKFITSLLVENDHSDVPICDAPVDKKLSLWSQLGDIHNSGSSELSPRH